MEIREKIWKLVLGDRTIHILPTVGEISMHHRVCRSNMTEDEACQKFNSHDEICYEWLDRHHNCYPSNLKRSSRSGIIGRGLGFNKEQIGIKLLRVCRQAYSEAAPVLYSSNIFTFNWVQDIEDFMFLLNGIQKRWIRKIHLDLNRRPCVKRMEATMGSIRSLKGLHTLHVSLQFRIHESQLEQWQNDEFFRERRLKGILRWQVLNLNKVTITFVDASRADPILDYKDHKRIAKEIREKISVANGSESYGRLTKKLQGHQKQKKDDFEKRHLEKRKQWREYKEQIAAALETRASGPYPNPPNSINAKRDLTSDSEVDSDGYDDLNLGGRRYYADSDSDDFDEDDLWGFDASFLDYGYESEDMGWDSEETDPSIASTFM